MPVSADLQAPRIASKSAEPLVYPADGLIEAAPGKTLWLYSMLAASALLLHFRPSLTAAAWALSLTALTLCAGHSVGLHRGIIHKSYRCSPLLRGALAYLFVHTGIGGPVSWIRLHHVRDHYQNTSHCPRYFRYDHSLWRDYWWNLHLRFVPRDPEKYGVPREDEHDAWLVFLERTWPLHVLALGAALCWRFGLSAALLCVPARVVVSVLGHWFVGFRAHQHGGIRYALDGSAEIGRNLPLLGVLSFGEGFHNNHHASPSSARMGEAWYELDLGFLLLLGFEQLGWVHDLQASGRSKPLLRGNARPVDLVSLVFAQKRHSPPTPAIGPPNERSDWH